MPDAPRVAAPPPKPLLIYDGDCGFCRRCTARLLRATGDALDCLPFQDPAVAQRFPEIPLEDFRSAVYLILPDATVCSGAEAIFRAFAEGGRERWLLWLYRKFPPFANITEIVYDEVALHREFISKLDRFFLGAEIVPRDYSLVQMLFTRGLAVIYLIAFASLWLQIDGLIGNQGITPASETMTALKAAVAAQHIGLDRYRLVPTLAWWSASDSALHWQCGAGVGLSLLVLAGIAPAPALFLLWALYLSLSSIAPPFLNFQWDALLLETGLLAIFFAPLQIFPRRGRHPQPSRAVLWLLRWLLFRLMFESGFVKLASGDESWRRLTALRVHFETQPLPTWIGWYAHQLPHSVLSVVTFLLFLIELAVPFLIFCGRKPRQLAACLFIILQVLILLTGNYTFFNLLTILLCLTLFDDEALRKLIPKPFRKPAPPEPFAGARWPWKITLPFAALVLILTVPTLPMPQALAQMWPRPLVNLYSYLYRFNSFNTYGLFASMTQTRPEIIVEASNDGKTWQPYEFKYKPGDLSRPPQFVAPFQPRLDWQMWFAALEPLEKNPWFLRLEYQLLKNSPPVVALLARNPFPDQPPKFIRAELYQYHFTDFATRRATGNWWRRDYLGEFTPTLSLADFQTRPAN